MNKSSQIINNTNSKTSLTSKFDYVEQISIYIELLLKVVQEYIGQGEKTQSHNMMGISEIRHQLYSLVFNSVINNLANDQKMLSTSRSQSSIFLIEKMEKSIIYQQQCEQDYNNPIFQELRIYLQEFKQEMLSLIVKKPNYSMFDFLTSQFFNDFWDVLTMADKQIQDGQNLQTSNRKSLNNNNLNYSFDHFRYKKKTLQKRSKSMEFKHQTQNKDGCKNYFSQEQQNKLQKMDEIEFILTQQLVYNNLLNDSNQLFQQMKYSNEQKELYEKSPNKRNTRGQQKSPQPQLFSFDSSFVKDLPLQKYNNISNFDTNFSLTVGKDSSFFQKTLCNVSEIINEENEVTQYDYNTTQQQQTSRFQHQLQDNINQQRTLKNSYKKNEQQQKQFIVNEQSLKDAEAQIIKKEQQLQLFFEELSQERQRLEQEFLEFDQMREEFEMYKEEELDKIDSSYRQFELLQYKIQEKEKYLNKENEIHNVNKIRQEKPIFIAPETLGYVKGNLKKMMNDSNSKRFL